MAVKLLRFYFLIIITKFLINVLSFYSVDTPGGRCGDPPPPIRYDGDVPQLDRSRVRGEAPDALLPVSSQTEGGKERGRRKLMKAGRAPYL